MNKVTNNRTYGSVLNPQNPGVAKGEITCESTFREEGIDEVFVARKLKNLLRAQGRRWNPKKGCWEKFDDYGTRLAALWKIAKILGIYPVEGGKRRSEDYDRVLVIDTSAIPLHGVRTTLTPVFSMFG